MSHYTECVVAAGTCNATRGGALVIVIVIVAQEDRIHSLEGIELDGRWERILQHPQPPDEPGGRPESRPPAAFFDQSTPL